MNIPLRLFTIVLLLLAGSAASATTFTVSNTNDAGTGSLRAAIIAANADNTATTASPHIINATGISGTISLQSSLPLLIRPMTINGPGASSLTITRGVAATFGIIEVDDLNPITIRGVTITNGKDSFRGGAIFYEGILTLINTRLSGNEAKDGGAIYTFSGTVILINTTVSGNTATESGGGIYNNHGQLIIRGSTFSGNSASFGGGALASNGIRTVTIDSTTFSGNSALQGGGAISNFDSPMTLTHVTISGNTGRSGGGIHNNNDESELRLSHCTVTGNTASNNTASEGHGGGIYNHSGTLTLDTTTVSDNRAMGGTTTKGSGGGIYYNDHDHPLTLTNSIISDNTASEHGGGIFVDDGTLTILRSTISDNSVTSSSTSRHGGGIFLDEGRLSVAYSTISGNTAGSGAGIYATNASATLTSSTISGNVASADLFILGGGIYSGGGELEMTACTVNGNNASSGGGIWRGGGEARITSTTFTNDTAGEGGGMTCSGGTVTIDSSTFSRNIASVSSGGGIIALNTSITVTNTTISHNSAERDGGGIYHYDDDLSLTNITISHNSAHHGGGIFNDEGGVEVINSTIDSNDAHSDGGGICNDEGTIETMNATIAGNEAGAFGGGISNHGIVSLLLFSTTIANNRAGVQGGGLYKTTGTLLTRNIIIAGNDATGGPDVYGTINSQGHNIIGNTSGNSGGVGSDKLNVNPQLGPLQNNGGPTLTMAINCTSPALDAGDNTIAPTSDQRGEPRITDGNCDGTATIDIGAYEFQNDFPPTIVLSSSPIELSPVNHNYQTVNLSSVVTDVTEHAGACTAFTASDVVITRVTSDEPEDANGGGDGNTVDDIAIASNCKSVKLRAERDGNGNGRVYRIYVRVADGCGNADEKSFKVSVRKGNGAAVENSVAYSETSSCSTAHKEVIPLPLPLPQSQPRQPAAEPGISLMESYPNPFSTSTVIGYSIGTAGAVRLTVFDISGRAVATLVDEVEGAGTYSVLFNSGELPDGTYYYTLESNGEQRTGSMVLMK
jgi:predicted outer membrane repeat protein